MGASRIALAGVLACIAGCTGGGTPKDDGPAAEGPAGVPADELQARLQQWGDALDEEHPLSFPGDAESLAWEQRKREAAEAFIATGAAAVPTLHRLIRSPSRTAAVTAVACLAEIRGPEALAELRALVDDAAAALNPDDVDHELTQYAIEGLGRHGDRSDVERLRPFLAGGAPLNVEVMSGPTKRSHERRAVLQNAAADAMAYLGVNDGMPTLLGNLGGGGWARRDAGIRMQRLTGRRFGFALDAPRPQREASIQAALAWWAAQGPDWKPADLPLQKAHDIYVREN